MKKETANLRSSSLIPSFCLLFAFLLHCGCVSNTAKLPPKIATALSRIPKIPEGMTEGQIFGFLGLPKPEEPFVKEVANPFQETCTRYEIGFGDSFALHCESINPGLPQMKPINPGLPQMKMTFSYDDGVLFRVRILRLVSRETGGEKKYELIPPEWYPCDTQ